MTTAAPDVISALSPFPAVGWWRKILHAQTVCFDLGERFQKMGGSNRYHLSGPQGRQSLSIPLKGGRQQKCRMREVAIFYEYNWQAHHWKTLTTLYGNAPYFAFFAPEIQELYQQKTEQLYDWNLHSIILVSKLLELPLTFVTTDQYLPEYPPETTDLRNGRGQPIDDTDVTYYQVFESRSGFQPNCSILDLLFCEGPYARLLLKS